VLECELAGTREKSPRVLRAFGEAGRARGADERGGAAGRVRAAPGHDRPALESQAVVGEIERERGNRLLELARGVVAGVGLAEDRGQQAEDVASEQRPPGGLGEPQRKRKRRQAAEAAMLQRRSELTGIVSGASFDPLDEPAMERPPRLVGKTTERSLAHQIVRQ